MILALGIFAWQQGSGSEDSGGPLNAIAAAAERTQDQAGGRAVMKSVVTAPSPSKSLTMTGRMVYDEEADRSHMDMTVTKTASGEQTEMEMLTDGSTFYMRSALFDPLPDGSEWMKLDLAFFEELKEQVPAEADAKGELELLKTAADDVRKLGKGIVRGVPTTRYSGTIDPDEQVKRLREEGKDALAALGSQQTEPLQIEVWIDREGLVRRMRYVTSEPGDDGEGDVRIEMSLDFLDFGSIPEIEVPDSAEVFDATAMAEEKLDLPGED